MLILISITQYYLINRIRFVYRFWQSVQVSGPQARVVRDSQMIEKDTGDRIDLATYKILNKTYLHTFNNFNYYVFSFKYAVPRL